MADRCSYCQLDTAGHHEAGCPNDPARVVRRFRTVRQVLETYMPRYVERKERDDEH